MKGFLVLLSSVAMLATGAEPSKASPKASDEASPKASEEVTKSTESKSKSPVKSKTGTKPKARSSAKSTSASKAKSAGESKETSPKVQPKSTDTDPEKASKEPAKKPDATLSSDDEGRAPTAKGKSPYGKPALIEASQLEEYATLPEDRRRLIDEALSTARESPWLPYRYGGSSPAEGGFDCSGAMYYVLGKAGLEPPRTSADQYLWLDEHKALVKAPPDVRDFKHPAMALLKPGDLLFWGGTYQPQDGRTVNITHVALYLGHEKKDKRPVMINATDGRSYRGTKANGYGVYDFQLPREGNRAVFMGYGTPPGVGKVP